MPIWAWIVLYLASVAIAMGINLAISIHRGTIDTVSLSGWEGPLLSAWIWPFYWLVVLSGVITAKLLKRFATKESSVGVSREDASDSTSTQEFTA